MNFTHAVRALVLWAGLFAAGCTVALVDPAGRACDDAHPCGSGRVCVDGVCLAPGGGGDPDAGADAGVDAGADDGGLDAGESTDGGGDAGVVCEQAGEPCTVGLGACARQGEVVCEGGVPRCDAEAGEPTEEVCDGLDNDCDGEVDEPGELLPPACPLNEGVCAGAQRECLGTAGWSDCTYGSDYEAVELRCDGLDNDCNGVADDVTACLHTVAGDGPPGLRDGIGLQARLAYPNYLTLGPDGLLYVAESSNHTIRRVDLATGALTTLAGTGRCGSQDGPLATATLCDPIEVGFDAAGVLYFTEWGGRRLRKIENGQVTTLAGNGNYGNTDGAALGQATFRTPCGLDVLPDGDVLIADAESHRIRRYHQLTSTVTTVAGSSQGNQDGSRLTMRFDRPCDVALAQDGTLYVSELSGDRVRKVPLAGNSSVLAGSPGGSAGNVDGVGTSVLFDDPYQLLLDEPAGLIYVADADNRRVRAVPLDGTSPTWPVVGGTSRGYQNGLGAQARFRKLAGLARVGTTWYLSDSENHAIRVAQQGADFDNGLIDTLLGAPPEFARDGAPGEAMMDRPDGLLRLPDGRFVWGEGPSGLLRITQPGAPVTTLAGSAYVRTYVNGGLGQARFREPNDLALGPDGALYVADGNMHGIRKVDLITGLVTTFAGHPSSSVLGTVDGPLTQARFHHPVALTFGKTASGQDVMFVADEGSALIRRIPFPAGPVSTLAGIAGTRAVTDGPQGTGTFQVLEALWADGADNLWVGDGLALRRVDAAGTVVTVIANVGFTIRDIEQDGTDLVLVGTNALSRFDPVSKVLTPEFSLQWGYVDGPTSGDAAAYDLHSLWVTPEAYWLLDAPAGRLRRLWR